ncbi:MAG TPA: OsmC family protein [Coriobacteriia bacterium]
MDIVHVRWVDRRQFVGWDSKGHGIVMDGAAGGAGEGTGVRPIELVLYGLAGCTAMDVVSVLEKKRLDVRGVEIIVTGEQQIEEYPHYYESISLEYVVTGVGIPDAAVARAIELSETKYCSVKGTLGPQVTVTTSFRVVEPPAPGPRPADGEPGA